MLSSGVEPNPGPGWREDYQVHPSIIPSILEALRSPTPVADLFWEPHNLLFPPYPGKPPDAFKVSWNQLLPLWANPPFQDLDKVQLKIEFEGAYIVLIVPAWRSVLPGLWRLSFRQHPLP